MATRTGQRLWHWRFWEREPDDCTAIEPLLSLYSDDMASESEARRVTAHLPNCEGCRQTLQWMQATRQVIVNRPVAIPPADLRARIARAIAESEAPQVPVRSAPRLLALRPALGYGFSVALLAILGGSVLWNDAHQSPVQHAVPSISHPVVATNQPSGLPTFPQAAPLAKQAHHVPPPASMVANRNTPTLVHHHVVLNNHPDLTAMADTEQRAIPPKVILLRSVPHTVAVHPRHHTETAPSETLLANQPHPTLLPTPSLRALHPTPAPQENTQVANLPPPTAPPSVRVLPPTVTPDQVHVASLGASPSLNDTLHRIAVSFNRAKITSSTFVANRNTIADNVAIATADSSGTAPITQGPVR